LAKEAPLASPCQVCSSDPNDPKLGEVQKGTLNDKHRYSCFPIYTGVIALLLAACHLGPTPLPAQTGTFSPAPSPTATCYLQPQPTGEKVIPIQIETPPPAQAQPGESISIHFSGGYTILNNARVCGENNIVEYVYADELPSFSYQRTVRVLMDDDLLAAVECNNKCRIALVIPADTSLGMHQLRLQTPHSEMFDIKIVDAGTPSTK
jgi:hypothetical protein